MALSKSRWFIVLVGSLLPATLASGAPAPTLAPAGPPKSVARQVRLQVITTDTDQALGLVAIPGDAKKRVLILEKTGRVRIWDGQGFAPEPFLDLRGKVTSDPRPNSEQGFLGLVFHPRFAQNGRFFVNYTDLLGDTRVVEMRVDKANPDRADLATMRLVLMADQPFANHNGGGLAFGPDGKLYVLLGDGGSANDPFGNAQNDQSLLGKALRLDPDAVNTPPEVWGKGLRNPWRFTFDAKTNDLYVADVGQNLYEYLHVVPARELTPGKNFGWNWMEGLHCFQDKPCDPKRFRAPVIEYPHSEGCSITGGYVYRGKALPALNGLYFYADYCTGFVRSLRMKNGVAVDRWDWKATLDPDFKLAKLASFGVDLDGELYLVSHEGPIYKFVPAAR